MSDKPLFKPGFTPDNRPLPAQFSLNRRTSVSAENMEHSGTTTPAEPPEPEAKGPALPLKEQEELCELLKHIFLFASLNSDSLKFMVSRIRAQSFKKGETIIEEGQQGDYFYVLSKGSVEFLKDGKVVGTADDGSYFGELALLYNSPRQATVVALSDVETFVLDRMTFKYVVTSRLHAKREHSRQVLGAVDILKVLAPECLLKVADALVPVTFPENHVIIKEGDPGDYFYLVDDGTLEVSLNSKPLATLGKGDYFGELSLIFDDPRCATVTATSPVKLERLDKAGFTRLLGSEIVEQLRKRDPRDHSESQ